MSERANAEKYLRMRWAAERADRARLQAYLAAAKCAEAEGEATAAQTEADRLRGELQVEHGLGDDDHIDPDTLLITRAPT